MKIAQVARPSEFFSYSWALETSRSISFTRRGCGYCGTLGAPRCTIFVTLRVISLDAGLFCCLYCGGCKTAAFGLPFCCITAAEARAPAVLPHACTAFAKPKSTCWRQHLEETGTDRHEAERSGSTMVNDTGTKFNDGVHNSRGYFPRITLALRVRCTQAHAMSWMVSMDGFQGLSCSMHTWQHESPDIFEYTCQNKPCIVIGHDYIGHNYIGHN